MVSAVDIERATKEECVAPGCFSGGIGEFSWSVSQAESQGTRKFKVSVGRAGVRGSSKCVATRANFESVADIIAKHINKEQAK